MHVVQALATLNVGGSELVVTELSEHLRAAGHKVTVVGKSGPLIERIQLSGADHLDWKIGRKRLGTLSYIRKMAEWLSSHQPDIVHAHSRLPAWICWKAIQRMEPSSRPAFVTSMHGQYSVSFYSAIMARGDKVIAVSNHIRDFSLKNYRFLLPQDIVTIHGGTSREQFPQGYKPSQEWWLRCEETFPQLKNKRILLLPGRLTRYKGHPVFIELIASLAADFPDIQGVVVGQARTGSRYMAELEGIANREGVLNRITFTGLRRDMKDWMSASSIVFNLCSDPPEAFGRTVPEALRMGVPVIAWNHGGAGEVLETMFPEGAVQADSFEALLKKTKAFLSSAPSVPVSDAFLLSDSMNKTFELYQDLVKNGEP